jgi:hypothetical protein
VTKQQVIQHHSEEDVKAYIDAGERLLREAGYDDAERIALLPTVIGLLSSKTIMQQQQPQVSLAQMLPPGRLNG